MSGSKAFGGGSGWGSASQATNGTADGTRKTHFVAHLMALNTQFAEWINTQKTQHVTEVWTDGVQSYLKHSSALLAEYKDVLETAPGKPVEPTKPTFAFGGGPTFGSPASATNGLGHAFSFGGGAFGGSSGGAPSFGALGGTAPAFGLGGAAEEDDEADEEDPTPALEVGQGSDATLLSKHRVRLTSMAPQKTWAKRGAGTLTLRRPAGGGGAFVVFTTDTGKILVNSGLLPGVKPVVNAKAPSNLSMYLISQLEKDVLVEGGAQDVRTEVVKEEGLQLFGFESAEACESFRKVVMEHY